ncbi:MAG: sigma-70 family RNA polymerase sigma factor [Firmicutes bacterium]|nr:sigma-70 family RNA polymerase sigma factor [Bacillota bacterium]
MEENDYKLVKRCLKGDEKAFEEIVTLYKRKVYNIAYKFTRNKEDSSDITQEVFIKAYNSLDKYNPEYKFSTWILKITTNYCLDLKKKKSVDTTPLTDWNETNASTLSAENNYIYKENKNIIIQLINNLPKKYRILIIMYHQQNLSYKEMSDCLNLPLTKVKNRLYRARGMLKDNLESIRKEEF